MYQIIVLASVWRNHPIDEYGRYKHLPATHICMLDDQLPMHNLHTCQDL